MSALPPRACIGILGGGQLGRMLATAAAQLGFKTHVYSDVFGPACQVTNTSTIAHYEDLESIATFAKAVDVVTYEFENVPVKAALEAQNFTPVRPSVKALEVAQDRQTEKQFIRSLGLPVAPYTTVENPSELLEGQNTLTLPAILKTARLGYDGKGQVPIDQAVDEQKAKAILEDVENAPCVLEQRIDFLFEVSVLIVRGLDGQVSTYDCPLNMHRNGILDTSIVPSKLPKAVQQHGFEIARTIAEALDYVGVLAVEMFYLGEGNVETLMVNEIAPRVHNSGHWTLDACAFSQFENHIRAVAGWPLGSTHRHSDAKMTNLIGQDVDAWRELASEPNCCVHIYGKPETRKGRKMGHVTRLAPLTP